MAEQKNIILGVCCGYCCPFYWVLVFCGGVIAAQQAGCARFRPIILTSVTTIAGLTPLLLETSIQAQILIPMAVWHFD